MLDENGYGNDLHGKPRRFFDGYTSELDEIQDLE